MRIITIRVALTLFALLILAAPALSGQDSGVFRATLKNGLRVVIVRNKTL
jgi:hypothetical protein